MLIITLLGLVIMSVLGLSIISIATSNYKITKVDSRSQGAYYIAEAGVNYMIDHIKEEVQKNSSRYNSSPEFFQYIENQFTKSTATLDSFDENNGIKPKAFVTVSREGIEENRRDYKIVSEGKIGESTRKVYSVISITWVDSKQVGDLDDIFIYCPKFSFTGSSINGEGGTIVAGGLVTHDLNGGSELNVTNLYFGGTVIMNGGSASFGSKNKPGSIYVNGDLRLENGYRNVYGDVYVNGNAKLKDVVFHGDVYVNGDVLCIENGPTPKGKIYYTGRLETPYWYGQDKLSKFIKVDSVPSFTLPRFDVSKKEMSWYSQNGYTIAGNISMNVIPDNAKYVVDSFYSNHHTSPKGTIVIISENDIEIKGWRNLTGVLVSLNGRVKLEVGSFTGVILSKDNFTASGGGWNINMRILSDFFTDSKIPIDIFIGDGSGNDDGGSDGGGSTAPQVDIIEPIKED